MARSPDVHYFVHRTGWGNPDLVAVKFVDGQCSFLHRSKREEFADEMLAGATAPTLSLGTALKYCKDESAYGWRELDSPAEIAGMLAECYGGIVRSLISVQLQDGYSSEWTCHSCGGDLLWCGCIEKERAALAGRWRERREKTRREKTSDAAIARPIKLRE